MSDSNSAQESAHPQPLYANSAVVKWLADLALWSLAGAAAYFFRRPDTLLRGDIAANVFVFFLISGLCLSVAHFWQGAGRSLWRGVGTHDAWVLFKTATVATVFSLAISFIVFEWLQLPRSVPVLTGMLGFLLMCAARLLRRMIYEKERRGAVQKGRRVLVVGAGEAGTLVAREMGRHPEAGMQPIGFVDDDPQKLGRSINGLEVLSGVQDLPRLVASREVAEVLIATPSASGEFVRKVISLLEGTTASYRIVPGVFEIISGEKSFSSEAALSNIRDVNVEDLLRRAPVQLNTNEIDDYLRGRVVMVTGAGGSIGSEIVRQLLRFSPSKIVLVGRGEGSIFAIEQELADLAPQMPRIALIGDVRDRARMSEIFKRERPQVVFHAAAHKHVPLMENSPSEAILNNVIGTKNVTELCLEHGVERLVNVSTDKAVNPTSVMGASKRMAEQVVSACAMRATPRQSFVSVRFGNVLGSRGSVVPTFLKQIKKGGPVTVTHPEMTRYFMTIPEAARLVLQAGGLAQNGHVYLLNMGDSVKIADLARDVIRLSGAKDIEIHFSGVRPGEKLYEELLTASEDKKETTHSEIFSANLEQVHPEELAENLREIEEAARVGDAPRIRALLARAIPENKFSA